MTKLTDDERQPCEIWTRVMGYHRPKDSFNIGKKQEFDERDTFREPKLTPQEEQAVSFVYGNTALENSDITEEMVKERLHKIKEESDDSNR